MSGTLRAAVIGVGHLGNFHLQKYLQNTDVAWLGVCDSNLELAQKRGLEHSVFFTSNLTELVTKGIDLATIATSTPYHFEVARFLLSEGIHLNIEKPITQTSEQAEELIALARAKNLKLTVGQVERFNPVYQELKSRKTKDPKFVSFVRTAQFKFRGADVSVLHDLLIHDIDLMLDYVDCGEPLDFRVSAGSLKTATPDWCEAEFIFKNGVRAQIRVSRVELQPSREMRVYFDDHYWVGSLGAHKIINVSGGDKTKEELKIEEFPVAKVDALQLETNTFVGAVLNKNELLVKAEEALTNLKWVERLLKKIALA